MPTPIKICMFCKESLPANPEHFHRNKTQPDGLRPDCKKCRRSYRSGLRSANINVSLKKERKSYQRNAVRHTARHRERWRNEPEHRAKWLAVNKVWHEKNKDQKRENNQVWRAVNPDKVKKYLSDAYKADPVRYSVSSLMTKYLRQAGASKGGKNFEAIVGYSFEQLRRHLEKQFTPEMSWQNYGAVWEVDHIQPLSAFIYTEASGPEFMAAWAITNLRPLAKIENRSKGGRRTLLL